ncbi:MAG TPA: SRPBCC family protein [Solirubrobacteraceae bacterium]|nr:SRPBCC family protein [Solirubrobacteraceae bacterium]
MRVTSTAQIGAPPEVVWERVGDLRCWPDFVAGLTRWEAEGRRRSGLGARYRALMRIGSADIGGLVEVVEFQPPTDLAWNAVTGAEQRGRWRLRPEGKDRTRVELRLTYHVTGLSPLAWLIERIAARAIRANLDHTVRELAKQLEHTERRRPAPDAHAAG